MSKGSKKKKKKDKVKYVDDGRTIADMSGIRRSRFWSNGTKSSFKEQSKTFFGAMKMMFVPMLITIGIISLAFLLTYLLLV